MRSIPLSVARSPLPSRLRYCRDNNDSMVVARVAGVPRPQSRMASDNSFSSSVRPAVSIAVSKVASVKGSGGLVVRLRILLLITSTGSCGFRPAGRSGFLRGARRLVASNTFQPGCSMLLPRLR